MGNLIALIPRDGLVTEACNLIVGDMLDLDHYPDLLPNEDWRNTSHLRLFWITSISQGSAFVTLRSENSDFWPQPQSVTVARDRLITVYRHDPDLV